MGARVAASEVPRRPGRRRFCRVPIRRLRTELGQVLAKGIARDDAQTLRGGPVRTCEAPDCFNPVRHGALCETHAKRLQRGSSLTAPVQAKNRSPRQAFLDAVHRYADADDDDEEEFRRADWALTQAGRRYFAGARGGVGRPLSIDAEEVARLFRQLKSVRAVARAMGRNVAVVHRVLVKSPVYRKFRNTRAGVRKPRDGES